MQRPRPDSRRPDRYNGEMVPEYNGYNAQYLDDESGQGEAKRILFALWHHKWLILACTLLGGLGAYLYAQRQIPIYKADGSMQISATSNRSSISSSDNLSTFLQSNYGFGMNSTIDNEIQVLRSRTFAREVAMRVFDEKYDSQGRLYPLLWADYPVDSTVVDAERVYARVRGRIDVQRADRTSDMVRLAFESPSKEEAARVVDLAIQTYSDVSVRMSRSQAKNAREFLSGEMERVNVVLDDAETNLQSFMNEQNLVKLDEQASELISAVSSLQAEKQSTEIRLASVKSSLGSYRDEIEKLSPGLPEQLTESVAPRLAQLQYALAEKETQKVLLLSRNPNMAEAEPALVDINNQIASIRKEIGTIASNLIGKNEAFLGFVGSADGNLASRFVQMRETILSLEIEETQLEAMLTLFDRRLNEYERQFNAIPDNMMELARRKRDLEMNEKLYMLIAEQAAETALWEQTQTGLGRVVDLAELPGQSIRPQRRLIYLMGIGFGMGLAVGFIFVRDLVNNRINSIEKLEEKGLPVLSIIPDFTKLYKKHLPKGAKTALVRGKPISTELTMVVDSISPISEAYRRLQSNVIYAQPDSPLKTLVVTSANKSEGKTTVVANLAVALAESGKKVVVLDADFRRPRLHTVYGVEREPGLIEVVFNEITVEGGIQPSVVPNVHVFATGKRPPNPVEISRSDRLKDLIDDLGKRYDHVLIDSPPFGIISDAASLIVQADAVILVCRFNQTKDPEFDLVANNLRHVNANVIGTVMTSFDPKKTSGSYYSSYYYKYNYESYGQYEAS